MVSVTQVAARRLLEVGVVGRPTNRQRLAALAIATLGCGADKNYGDPIENPAATQSALGAIANAQLLTSRTSNESALDAVNALSANFNLMTGAKLNRNPEVEQGVEAILAQVDEACVVSTTTTVTYTGCDYAGTTVNGTVTVVGSSASMSLRFESVVEDLVQTTDVAADVEISDTSIAGFVDYDVDVTTDETSLEATFDGGFDVDLLDGCAVSGELEVHAVAASDGRSISVWAKAEYGPDCQSVVVR